MTNDKPTLQNFQQSQTLQRFFEAARCHCQPCTHYCSLSLSMAQRLYNVVKSFTCMCSISSTLVCRGCPLRSGLVLLTCCPGPLLYVFMPNLFILEPPPRLVTKCKCMIRPTFCFKRVWSNLSSKFKCVLCCHAVTKPQRWMIWLIWPTNCHV